MINMSRITIPMVNGFHWRAPARGERIRRGRSLKEETARDVRRHGQGVREKDGRQAAWLPQCQDRTSFTDWRFPLTTYFAGDPH